VVLLTRAQAHGAGRCSRDPAGDPLTHTQHTHVTTQTTHPLLVNESQHAELICQRAEQAVAETGGPRAAAGDGAAAALAFTRVLACAVEESAAAGVAREPGHFDRYWAAVAAPLLGKSHQPPAAAALQQEVCGTLLALAVPADCAPPDVAPLATLWLACIEAFQSGS
jgi:hypothetical protein